LSVLLFQIDQLLVLLNLIPMSRRLLHQDKFSFKATIPLAKQNTLSLGRQVTGWPILRSLIAKGGLPLPLPLQLQMQLLLLLHLHLRLQLLSPLPLLFLFVIPGGDLLLPLSLPLSLPSPLPLFSRPTYRA
jgi:hypothetical protein